MAQFAMPAHLKADHTIILVCHGEDDRWAVDSNHDVMEASFGRREDALRFARSLRVRCPGAIIVETPAKLCKTEH